MAAARRITQATFDAAVAENVEEFEMEPDEAVADAIEQFRSQGVDLSNIVTEVGESKDEHPVLAPLKALQAAAEAEDGDESEEATEASVKLLTELATGVGDSKDNKTVAASNGAMELLASMVAAASDDRVVLAALAATRSIISKHAENRKRVPSDFVAAIANIIVGLPESTELMAGAVGLAAVLCFRCEDNKRTMYKSGAVKACMQLLDKAPPTAVLRASLGLIRNVLTNDDRDSPMSKCFDYARELHEGGLSMAVLSAARSNDSDPGVVSDCMAMVRAVCVNNTICTDVVEEGKVLELVTEVMTGMQENAKVAGAGAALLRTLAGNDDNKKIIGAPDSPTLKVLLQAMQTHAAAAKVTEHCCGALGALTLRCPENAVTLINNNAHVLLARAMTKHAASAGVCRAACLAVRNIVSRSPELREKMLGQGMQKLLEAIKAKHRGAKDNAKAALRDLGVDGLPTEATEEERKG